MIILHSSGSGIGTASPAAYESDSFVEVDDEPAAKKRTKIRKKKLKKKAFVRGDFSSSDEALFTSESDDDEEEDSSPIPQRRKRKARQSKPPASNSFRQQAANILKGISGSGGTIVITTYASVRSSKHLLSSPFAYCILDEGHRIRKFVLELLIIQCSPDSEVTLACKQIQTIHRLVLSGTVIQNKLVDLWFVV